MSAPRIVKKYGNRRLYDTKESRYITLDELAISIRAGESVKVVDAKSNRDLTQGTLAHIILESRGASKLLPVPLLEQLIRMGEQPLAEFFGMYLSGALEMYLSARRGAAAMMPYNPFGQMPYAQMNPFARLMGGSMMGWPGVPGAAAAPPPGYPPAEGYAAAMEPPSPEPEPSADEEARSDVADLRRELEELKRAIRGEPEAD
ncbi:MAG: polyhydroxyalkanoate synthesis regulator DNA-binding domain-containing protein [Sandaracinaceae bacterium]